MLKTNRIKLDMSGAKDPMNYEQYIQWHQDIIARKFDEHSVYQKESMYQYTCDNWIRFEKSLKAMVLDKKLYNFLTNSAPQRWIILTEPWCGDAAQLIPLFYALAVAQPAIELEFYLRDENEALMNQALTNGGKAIPKLLVLQENDEIAFTWGPRPIPAQELVMQMKEQQLKGSAFNQKLDAWYENDRHQTAQTELYQLLKSIYIFT